MVSKLSTIISGGDETQEFVYKSLICFESLIIPHPHHKIENSTELTATVDPTDQQPLQLFTNLTVQHYLLVRRLPRPCTSENGSKSAGSIHWTYISGDGPQSAASLSVSHSKVRAKTHPTQEMVPQGRAPT